MLAASQPAFSSRVWSLLEIMEKFRGEWLLRSAVHISELVHRNFDEGKKPDTTEAFRLVFNYLGSLHYDCKDLGFNSTSALAGRLMAMVKTKQITFDQLKYQSAELLSRLNDELAGNTFIYLNTAEAEMVRRPIHGWEDALRAFPDIQTEIEEASACTAFERATAAVFHLMRIVEMGVQHFSAQFPALSIATEKQWQVILDGINKEIKSLPDRTATEKRRKAEFGEIAAHLFNVKIAWRNPTMHPKNVYTIEQAKDVYTHSRAFMNTLGNVLKPKP